MSFSLVCKVLCPLQISTYFILKMQLPPVWTFVFTCGTQHNERASAEQKRDLILKKEKEEKTPVSAEKLVLER